jgi:hypothetical protein
MVLQEDQQDNLLDMLIAHKKIRRSPVALITAVSSSPGCVNLAAANSVKAAKAAKVLATLGPILGGSAEVQLAHSAQEDLVAALLAACAGASEGWWPSDEELPEAFGVVSAACTAASFLFLLGREGVQASLGKLLGWYRLIRRPDRMMDESQLQGLWYLQMTQVLSTDGEDRLLLGSEIGACKAARNNSIENSTPTDVAVELQ